MTKIMIASLCSLPLYFWTIQSAAQNDSLPVSEGTPSCITTSNQGEISELLVYLFAKYGVEDTEAIMIDIRAYQAKHNVLILSPDAFLSKMSSFQKEKQQVSIAGESAIDEQILLFRSIVDIESDIIKH
jgi:hypothetical protein